MLPTMQYSGLEEDQDNGYIFELEMVFLGIQDNSCIVGMMLS